MKRFRTSRILSAFLLIVMVMSLFPVSVFAGKAAISVSLPEIPVMGVGNFLRDTPIDDAAVYITVGEETWKAEGTFAWKNPDIQFKKQGKYTCVCMFIPSGSDAQLISTVSFKVPITVYRLNLVITELPQAAEIPVGSMLKDAELTGGDAINYFEKNLEIEGHFEFVEPEEVMEDVGEFERAVRFKPDLGRMYNPTVTTLERDAYGNFLEAFVSVNVFDPNAPAEEEAEEETLETGEEPVFAEITEPAEEIKEIEESAEPAEEPVEPAEESAEPAEEKLSGIALAESILKQPGRRIALTIKELPTVSGEAKKGERLDTLTLEGGSAVFYKTPNDPVKGRFVWYDGSTEIGSEESYPVIFIPENTSKYNPATVTFERVNGKFLDAFVAVPLGGGSESAAAPEAESESADKPVLTQLGYELADELMKQPGRRIALTIKELPTVSGEAKRGERLDTLTLEGGSAVFYKTPNDPVKGRFVWYDGSTEIGSGESYPVIFIPENTSRYNPATVTFERVNGKFLDAFVAVPLAGGSESAAAPEAESESADKPVLTQLGYELADELMKQPGRRIALTIKELPTVSGEAKKGERLDTLTLEGGSAVFYKAPNDPVKGRFVWYDGSTEIGSEESYPVIFIPENTSRYNPATVTFERVNGKFLDAFVSVNAASDGEDAAAEEAEPEEETASVSVLTGREQADAILSRPGLRIALTVKELPTVSGELKKGERLDSLKLEGGCAVFYKAPGKPVAGHFEWLDGSEIIDETGELKREVVFIPDDVRAYNPATVTFERGAGREFLPAAVIFTVK